MWRNGRHRGLELKLRTGGLGYGALEDLPSRDSASTEVKSTHYESNFVDPHSRLEDCK